MSSFANITTGWYDHEQIWYEGSSVVRDATAAANLAAQGQIVYHVERPDETLAGDGLAPVPSTASRG